MNLLVLPISVKEYISKTEQLDITKSGLGRDIFRLQLVYIGGVEQSSI